MTFPTGQLRNVCFAIGLVFVGNGMILPLVPLYSVSLGASPAVVGLIVAAMFVFPLFLAIPAGSLVDRHGPVRLMLAGTLLLAVSPLAVVLVPGFASVAFLQVLNGLGHLVAIVAAQSFVASLGDRGARERNFGWYTTFISIGQLVGPLVAGVIVDLVGFRTAFAVAGVVSALALVLMVRLDDSASVRSTGAAAGFPPARKVVEIASIPGVQVGLLVSSTIMIALVAHQSLLPAYLEGLAYSATLIGVVVSFRALVTIVVRPWMPQIITLLRGRYSTLFLMTATTAVGLALLGLTGDLAVILLLSGLIGVGQGIAQPLTMVTVVDNVPDAERGTALGLRLSANRLFQLAAPVLLGIVGQFGGYGAMFLVGGLLTAVTALVLLLRRTTYDTLETSR